MADERAPILKASAPPPYDAPGYEDQQKRGVAQPYGGIDGGDSSRVGPAGYPQQPYPQQQPHPQQPYYPQQYPGRVLSQPSGQPTHQVIVVGGCPACRVGVLEDDYTWCGVCLAVFCFPIGILCCLGMRERRCSTCGAIFG